MQTHASICSQAPRRRGGGGVDKERVREGGGNTIRSIESTDLDHVPLEFTFEFH